MKTILLVEDNRVDEMLIFQVLRQEGFREENIVVARDGLEALDYLFATGAYNGRNKNELPALVILDLHLPRLSGIEVLRRIRSTPHTQKQAVAIFSASLDADDLIQSDELGVTAYVHKSTDLVKYTRDIKDLIQSVK